MNDVDALREYGSFQAARRFTPVTSSATDVSLIDVTHVAEVEVTDPFVTRLTVERHRDLFPATPRIAEDVSSTSGLDLVVLILKPGEAKFVANMGDFAALDDLRTPEGRIRRQIWSARSTAPLMYRESLARRLEFLLGAMNEQEEAWNEDSPESLRMLLLFLQTVPDFRYPTVTVTPSATFRVEWTADPNRHFAADFLPMDKSVSSCSVLTLAIRTVFSGSAGSRAGKI